MFAQPGIYDSETKQPIGYAHILVKNKAFGATTNERGKFPVGGIKIADTLTVNAKDYAVKKVVYAKSIDSIFLIRTSHESSQSTLRKGNRVKESFLLDTEELSEPGLIYQINDQIVGQYFAPRQLYTDNPYLTGISVRIFSSKNKQFFNVVIRKRGEDGKPGDYVYDENILCEIKKEGVHVLHIDVDGDKIQLPPDGFFISFEKVVKRKSDNKSLIYVCTAFNPVPGNPKYSVYTTSTNGSGFKWVENKNYTVMMELELSN